MRLGRSKKAIKEVYIELYKSLKNQYPKGLCQAYLSREIWTALSKYGMRSETNVKYLTGFFRKNKVLVFNKETGGLVWSEGEKRKQDIKNFMKE